MAFNSCKFQSKQGGFFGIEKIKRFFTSVNSIEQRVFESFIH